MVEELTRRQCSSCGRLTTDYQRDGRYFCDYLCYQDWKKSRN